MKVQTPAMQARRFATRFFLWAGAAVLAGCAAFAPLPPEEAVKKRAIEYWNARIAGEMDKAYALTPPSYRKVRTADQFKSRFGGGVILESAGVYSVKCDSAEKCTARMRVAAKPALLRLNIGAVDTYLDEIWLLEDGQWWRYQEL